MGGVDEVQWLDDSQQLSWRAFLTGTLTLLDRLDEELQREHRLSLSDYEVLAQLSAAPAHRLRMSELADRALVSRSRLTHAVDRLEQRGFLRRQRCESDRRGLYAALTSDGFRALERAAPTHVAGVRRYLVDAISDRELLATGRAFEKVRAALGKGQSASERAEAGAVG